MASTKMKYSLKRALEQVNLTSLKTKIIPIGEVIKFIDIRRSTIIGYRGTEESNDTIIGERKDGTKLTIAVREFLKMTLEEGRHYQVSGEEGDDNIKFPSTIEIISMVGRTDINDNPVYPVFAYALHDKFIKGENRITWNELVDGGFVDKYEERFDQVQNYTIKVV